MDLDYHPITLCLLCSQTPPKAYNVLRTFHTPSEFISPMDVRFCFVVLAQLPNPLRVLSKTQPLAGAIGYGYWLLAIGYGLWAGACGVATIHASNLLPYRPFPAKGSVLAQLPEADAEALRSSASQNRWPVRRTSYVRQKGDKFGEKFGEHLK